MSNTNEPALRCELVPVGSLSPADLDALAKLHLQCLPDSLFSGVGLGATRCLYRFMARGGEELFVVARDADGTIRGASVASLTPGSLMRRLLLGSTMAAWLLLNAGKLPWQGLLDQQPAPGPERAELMFLFLAPAWRSAGAGSSLVALTEAAVRERGHAVLTVMTGDAPGNRAPAFYERLGYMREAAVRKYGRPFILLRRALG